MKLGSSSMRSPNQFGLQDNLKDNKVLKELLMLKNYENRQFKTLL